MGRQASDGSNTRPETTNSLDEENKSTSAASSCGLNTPLRSNRKLKTERDQMLCSFTEKNINNSAS